MEKNKIKYINPIIIGTLSLIIWEIAINNLTDSIGFGNILPIAAVSVYCNWLDIKRNY